MVIRLENTLNKCFIRFMKRKEEEGGNNLNHNSINNTSNKQIKSNKNSDFPKIIELKNLLKKKINLP